MYQALLTRRYLTSKVMPLLAAVAVTLCTAMVLIVWSVMGGFLGMLVASGRTLIGAQFGFGVTGLLVPLAVLIPSVGLPLVVAAEFLQWLTLLVYAVNAVSLRQRIARADVERAD